MRMNSSKLMNSYLIMYYEVQLLYLNKINKYEIEEMKNGYNDKGMKYLIKEERDDNHNEYELIVEEVFYNDM